MKVAVIGAGAMGLGIAQSALTAGHQVVIHDANTSILPGVRTRVDEGLQASVKRKKLTTEDAQTALDRLTVVEALDEIENVEIVVEAVIEDLQVKQALFADVEKVVSTECILASNTSSLAIGTIARGMQDPARLIGLHFFNPVPAMRLVEIVIRQENSDALITSAQEFVESLRKTGIQVMDSPGFLVNLAGRAYVTEALTIVDENVASVDQVDRIARTVLGFPLGPFELMDLTGLDVNLPVTTNIFDANFGNPRLRSTWYHRYLHEVGLLGRKTNGGFYRYEQDVASDRSPATGDSATPPTSDPQGSIPDLAVSAQDEGLARCLQLAGIHIVENGEADITILSPLGLDVSTACTLIGADPRRTVGIDTMFGEKDTLTLMVPPGVPTNLVSALEAQLMSSFTVEVINDSPGFVAQRLVAAVVNLGCEIAQRGVASPQDIDTAVQLGLRYPHGPLALADEHGPSIVLEVLESLHRVTGDDRYAPSTWLVRRARAGLSILEDDHIPARERQRRPLIHS